MRRFFVYILIVSSIVCGFWVVWQKPSSYPSPVPEVQAQTSVLHWPMPGHDVARTSWANGELNVSGGHLLWHKKIDPYIPSKAQLITYPGSGSRPDLILVPTAKGLYAYSANPTNIQTSNKENMDNYIWFYPTEMPVGQSPSIVNDVVYVGVFDKTIHAININTGQKIWQTLQAGAGFDTNPLVVNGKVYAGNRDGYFYAFDATSGNYLWSFKTDGPISYSAAYDAGTLFFASNDSYAYAVNATTGSQIWKSQKLPGDGFYSWWPVVHNGKVFFSGSNNFAPRGSASVPHKLEVILHKSLFQSIWGTPELGDLPDCQVSTGNCIMPTPRWMNGNPFSNYLTTFSDRRTLFYFSTTTGQELTPYAPILWTGNGSGTKYPPVVGPRPDSTPGETIYGHTVFRYDTDFLHTAFVGWDLLTNQIKPLKKIAAENDSFESADENQAGIVIGSKLFWNHKDDQKGGIIDLADGNEATVLNTWALADYLNTFGNYFDNVPQSINWSQRKYGNIVLDTQGVPKGLGTHGNVNPPVPIRNKVCWHASNAIICYGQ